MTPSQEKLAEIDARWALEAQAERQRLIGSAVRSVESTWWWKCVPVIAIPAILFGTSELFKDRQDQWLWCWVLMALVFVGLAMHGVSHNARRLDAIVKLLNIDGGKSIKITATEKDA